MPNDQWRQWVVYQVYPRSFADSTGDGVGDLRGVLAHLNHLRRLGVDVVWLSPVYRSPMDDNGYDISDYQDVDPLFGTLADLDELIAELHARGYRAGCRAVEQWPRGAWHQHPNGFPSAGTASRAVTRTEQSTSSRRGLGDAPRAGLAGRRADADRPRSSRRQGGDVPAAP